MACDASHAVDVPRLRSASFSMMIGCLACQLRDRSPLIHVVFTRNDARVQLASFLRRTLVGGSKDTEGEETEQEDGSPTFTESMCIAQDAMDSLRHVAYATCVVWTTDAEDVGTLEENYPAVQLCVLSIQDMRSLGSITISRCRPNVSHVHKLRSHILIRPTPVPFVSVFYTEAESLTVAISNVRA